MRAAFGPQKKAPTTATFDSKPISSDGAGIGNREALDKIRSLLQKIDNLPERPKTVHRKGARKLI